MTALLIFIKNPEKGTVKAPIAALLGEDAALRIHQQLLAHTRYITSDLPLEKFLCYEDYPNWNDAWDISTYHKRVQQGDKRADRIMAAFETIAEEGHDRAVIIGSDCDELRPEIIWEAIEAVEGGKVAVGPTPAGGCYLLGMQAAQAALFADIPWDAPAAFAAVKAVIDGYALPAHVLPALHSLDTMEDLLRSGVDYGGGAP